MMTASSKLRVAFVCHPWDSVVPPVETGSIPIWTYQVMGCLADACDFVVYSMWKPGREPTQWYQGVQYRRISTATDLWLQRVLRRWPGVGRTNRPLFGSRWYHPAYSRSIAKDLARQPCDIVHVHQFSQFVPVIRAWNPDVRIVLHMQSEWLTQLDGDVISRRLSDADMVICCSQYLVDRIAARFPQFAARCTTVFNGVDLDRFAPPEGARSKEQEKHRRLLFVGRVSPEKGLHVVIDAFTQVAERYPDVVLDIVGPEGAAPFEFIVGLSEDQRIADLAAFYTGSYMSHLRDRLPPHLADRVTFAGAIPHSELASRYQQADILLNPSFTETFGMSLIEAMACNVPVVVTRVGGMEAIVERTGGGLMVAPGDSEALADAILQLLSDEDLRKRMGQAGAERVRELFSWERVATDLLSRYEELMGRHA
jgi:glycosyltransferase involved in cell wall biosynthesis